MKKIGGKNGIWGAPKYTDSNKLREKMFLYFQECDKKRLMPNKAGLCVFLNVSRETYNRYKTTLSDAFDGVEERIENAWVQRLSGGSPAGAIFYLKNAFPKEFRNYNEVDITSQGEKVVGINYIVPHGHNNIADDQTASGVADT